MSDLLDKLKYKSEGDSLDLKREQYAFCGANNYIKSELLKDILAMANSWSQETRYIAIGATEGKPPPHQFNGISPGLIDDA